jgi:multisubunit Na+/H+ antiporter MnhB subunit
MLVFSPLMGGIPLEAPIYQAMLWPPALIALALVTTLALPERGWSRLQAAAGVLAVIVVIATGHVTPGLGLAAGWLLAAAVVAVFLIASYKGTIGAIAGLALLLSGAQLLQNSRGDLGLYYLSPYNWAFSANPISDRIHTAVNTQEWLLANTARADQILSWVDGAWADGDRELYVVAGMQLWGENRVTLEPTLTPEDVARLDAIRPSVIAMYGQTMDGVLDFWSSIPAENAPTAPDCYDFAWAPNPASEFQVTEGHACLTRLTWPG